MNNTITKMNSKCSVCGYDEVYAIDDFTKKGYCLDCWSDT